MVQVPFNKNKLFEDCNEDVLAVPTLANQKKLVAPTTLLEFKDRCLSFRSPRPTTPQLSFFFGKKGFIKSR